MPLADASITHNDVERTRSHALLIGGRHQAGVTDSRPLEGVLVGEDGPEQTTAIRRHWRLDQSRQARGVGVEHVTEVSMTATKAIHQFIEGLVDVMVEHAGMLARVLQGADDGATQMCAVVPHFVRK